LEQQLKTAHKDYVIVLLSEIFPAKLSTFTDIDAWIQIACPRLSIDWGYAFTRPLLSPFEATAALTMADDDWTRDYPMDFYSSDVRAGYGPNYKE
jgi:2-(3-amino-3-carboxypropyl)histidine synthase